MTGCVLQVKSEIAGSLDFLQAVYTVFGFTFKLYLSTRPEKYMGDIALWDTAEKVWPGGILCVCVVTLLSCFFTCCLWGYLFIT